MARQMAKKIDFWEARYFSEIESFLLTVRYFFGDREVSMEREILAWSSGYLFEDCETCKVESRDPLLRLSRDTLSCPLKLCNDPSVLSRETFVVLQIVCSFLCCLLLNENEDGRFCPTKIKIPTYSSQNFFVAKSLYLVFMFRCDNMSHVKSIPRHTRSFPRYTKSIRATYKKYPAAYKSILRHTISIL